MSYLWCVEVFKNLTNVAVTTGWCHRCASAWQADDEEFSLRRVAPMRGIHIEPAASICLRSFLSVRSSGTMGEGGDSAATGPVYERIRERRQAEEDRQEVAEEEKTGGAWRERTAHRADLRSKADGKVRLCRGERWGKCLCDLTRMCIAVSAGIANSGVRARRSCACRQGRHIRGAVQLAAKAVGISF